MNNIEIKKAIEDLKEFANGNTYDTEYTDFEIFNLAIESLEKQILKKGIPYDSSKNHNYIECSVCHEHLDLYYKYCSYCGQKLDWSKE